MPLTATGVDSARQRASTRRGPAGLAPATVDPGFRNASLQSWNVNVQRQLAPRAGGDWSATSGSHGSNLRISRNINQPVTGVRPFAGVSRHQPDSSGRAARQHHRRSRASAFRTTTRPGCRSAERLSRGLQFDASYTWSKSLDTNSLNSSGFAVQDGYDIPDQYGLSDFDARHRFVLSATYALPFTGHAADARMAARGDRAVAERQSRQHRHQQQHPERHAEHACVPM